MSAALRTGVRLGLNRPGVFCVVAAALTLEFVARVAVGVVANPLSAVLLPPFLGVLVLGGAFPVVRAAAADEESPWVAFPATVGARWPSLLAFAAVGHLLAVVVGTALFLVGDTAVRYLVYAAVGEHLPAGFVVYLPVVGVAGGALLAWSLLPPAVGPLLDREELRPGLRAGLRTAALTVVEAPRRTAVVLAAHAVGTAVVAATALTALVYTGGVRSPLRLLLVGGGLTLIAGTVLTQFVYSIHVASSLRPVPTPDAETLAALPTRRVAVAALLCVSLVAGAGAVRVTETRPMDTAPEPLPDDPTAAYAVALENTDRSDHVYVASSNVSGEDRATARRVAVDRSNRRYLDRTVIAAPDLTTRTTLYGSSGVVAYDSRSATAGGANASHPTAGFGTVAAAPGYWTVRHGTALGASAGGRFSLPTPRTGQWRVANRADGRLTLVATGEAAYEAAFGHSPPASVSVESARVRMVVDTDRGVVTGGDATVRTRRTAAATGTENAANATNATTETRRSVTTFRYDARVDTSVGRPARLRSPTLSEWAWRLFTY